MSLVPRVSRSLLGTTSAAAAVLLASTLASCGGGGSSPAGHELVSLITTQVPGATTGVAYTAQMLATFPNAPGGYYVSGGQLPTGLVIDHGTGAISGYPRQTGVFHFEIAARDGIDPTLPPGRDASFAEDRRDFTVTVGLGEPNILPQVPPAAQYRASYGYQIDVAGG